MATRKVVALTGGVGGAKLVDGLGRLLGEDLTVVVNTGDDFSHWGLAISPDVDTVLYTLAGIASAERGWGLEGETFRALGQMKRLGGESWFALGDSDLALHLLRTSALAGGQTLTEVTSRIREALGVRPVVLPMTDGSRRTVIVTRDDGELDFQTWLVRRRAEPRVVRVRFEGAPAPSAAVLRALADARLVVIGPSNPYVSIDPILSLPGLRSALAPRTVVAVSPIVAGSAVKGPLATMLTDIDGLTPSAAAVARHYGALLSGFVVERGDGFTGSTPLLETSTVMRTMDDRTELARELLAFAEGLGP